MPKGQIDHRAESAGPIPDHVIADRDARAEPYIPTPNELILGDPRPSRSALAQRARKREE